MNSSVLLGCVLRGGVLLDIVYVGVVATTSPVVVDIFYAIVRQIHQVGLETTLALAISIGSESVSFGISFSLPDSPLVAVVVPPIPS